LRGWRPSQEVQETVKEAEEEVEVQEVVEAAVAVAEEEEEVDPGAEPVHEHDRASCLPIRA